jgi:iron-sulfur cluster assembly protein
VLEVTQTAIDAIKHITPADSGLRIYLSGGAPDINALQVEIAEAPKAGDQVVEAEGAQVFLEPQAADTLDDMVLDVMQDARGVRFAVTQQDPPGSAPGEAGDSSAA